jgi:dolichol kinase
MRKNGKIITEIWMWMKFKKRTPFHPHWHSHCSPKDQMTTRSITQVFAHLASAPIRLHSRTDLHLARKVWHAGMGTFIASIYLYSGMSAATALVILGSFLGLDLFVEMLRLRVPTFNEKVMRSWGFLMRSSEINRISGVPYYLGATMLTIAIFPKTVAILAILYLAWGDPVASLMGILYGKKGPQLMPGRSLIGTASGVFICGLLTAFFVTSLSLPWPTATALVLIGALSGGLAELIPFDMDDNFVIPVVSGFMLWLGLILLPI